MLDEILIISGLAIILGPPMLIAVYILVSSQQDRFHQLLGWFILKSMVGLGSLILLLFLITNRADEKAWILFHLVVEIGFALLLIVVFQSLYKTSAAWGLLVFDIFRTMAIHTFFPLYDSIGPGELFAVFSALLYSIIGLIIFQSRKKDITQ